MSPRNGMVLAMLGPFMLATRECAMQMLSNAVYVLGELPNVKMAEGLSQRTREVCAALISTKHDLITELFDLDDLVASEATDAQVGERVERIVRWASEDVRKLHGLATALDQARSMDDLHSVQASILVMESANNVLRAYQPMRKAAEAVMRAVNGVPLQGASSS